MKSRMLRQEYFIDDKLAECGEAGQLLFLGMLGLADREGRLEDRPYPIKVQIMPYSKKDINVLLDSLHEKKLIVRYEIEGSKYIQINDFVKHQTIHPKEATSIIPAPKDIAIPCNFGKDEQPSGKECDAISISKGKSISKVMEGECEGKPKPPTLEKIGSHFKANPDQIADLISQDGEKDFKDRVQTINDYCAATGKTYKDYPAAYRNFRKRDKQRAQPPNVVKYETKQDRNMRIIREGVERARAKETSKAEVVDITPLPLDQDYIPDFTKEKTA